MRATTWPCLLHSSYQRELKLLPHSTSVLFSRIFLTTGFELMKELIFLTETRNFYPAEARIPKLNR
jgi:hypothetical protein